MFSFKDTMLDQTDLLRKALSTLHSHQSSKKGWESLATETAKLSNDDVRETIQFSSKDCKMLLKLLKQVLGRSIIFSDFSDSLCNDKFSCEFTGGQRSPK
jgi:hypothetical protein